MKFLLVVAVLVVAFWVWRNNRRRQAAPPPTRRLPEPMVACAQCGTHLPDKEAVKSAQGTYCSEAHRRQHEGPAP
jgi:uncharacterized protein